MSLPVLIITYSRVKGLESLLNSCLAAGVQRIYVAIDGPRDSKTSEIQEAMHKHLGVFESNNQIELHIWQRTKNLGICVSVVTAIDWFFKHEPAGVILEDDLVISKDFLDYSELALKLFETREDVVIISGNRYDGASNRHPVLVSYPQTWGWATWREKWKLLRDDISREPSEKVSARTLAISNFWQVGADRVWLGYVDTWDLLVARSLLLRSKKCLLPPGNLVSNVGIDNFSTHTKNDTFPIGFPIQNFSAKAFAASQTNSEVSEEANEFLERRVFGIRRRHNFLGLYRRVTELRLSRKFPAKSLNNRICEVLIP